MDKQPFQTSILSRARPDSVKGLELPTRTAYYPSPSDWRDEVLYFLLPDRFSDEGRRPQLDRTNLAAARPPTGAHGQWWWADWDASGSRWQGGTIKGIGSRLDYVKGLGCTTIWIGPVFKQRKAHETYHGYAIQDFLDVDPRFGTRLDLVNLVDAAHSKGMRVILDVIFNHSGSNWTYAAGTPGGAYKADYTSGTHAFGAWRDDLDSDLPGGIVGPDDGVWPKELQSQACYHRAGTGSLDGSDDPSQASNDDAEFRRTDFDDMRDFDHRSGSTLSDLARCFKYWIALTDCDGFRIDTLKHVAMEDGRNFCGAIKEYAASVGKADFFLVAEVAGGEGEEAQYSAALEFNMNATLSIGPARMGTLIAFSKGFVSQAAYFGLFAGWDDTLGSHRQMGRRHVTVFDDHDHAQTGAKRRFAVDAANDHEATAAAAIALLSLGIPCLYYGTEQGLAGPEESVRQYVPGWWDPMADRYLREAMFGPDHPLVGGAGSVTGATKNLDASLPGFGPFGTCGHECFDDQHPLYKRIAALATVRRQYPSLRYGRQYPRPFDNLGSGFLLDHGGGEIAAWSRILDEEEALVVVNTDADANSHGGSRGGDVMVDANLSAGGMVVKASTAEAAGTPIPGLKVGDSVAVALRGGVAYVPIRDLPPSECVVLVNAR